MHGVGELQSTTNLERIDQVLGAATYGRSGVRLYCGDCLELMKRLPPDIISLTVTSPPYNIGKPYEARRDLEEYLHWCELWLSELYRITSPQGALWLNLGYLEVVGRAKALPIPYLLWNRIPFYIVQEIVWNYGAGVASRRSFSPRNEKFLWCTKDKNNYAFNIDTVRDKSVKYPNQRKNGKLRCNPNGKNPTDVWQIPKVTSGKDRASKERTPHPAQFPIAVVERIIKASSNEGELVLDPFMGSGSTAEASLRTARQVLGFDLQPEYVAIAARRIDSYLARKATEDAQGKLLSFS